MPAERPVAELTIPLWKGAPSQQKFEDSYNLIVAVTKKGNIQTLEDLLRHSPTVNSGLSLARTSEETTTSYDGPRNLNSDLRLN